jgi:hypothetical protein
LGLEADAIDSKKEAQEKLIKEQVEKMKRKSSIKMLMNQYRLRKLIMENSQVAQDRHKLTSQTY